MHFEHWLLISYVCYRGHFFFCVRWSVLCNDAASSAAVRTPPCEYIIDSFDWPCQELWKVQHNYYNQLDSLEHVWHRQSLPRGWCWVWSNIVGVNVRNDSSSHLNTNGVYIAVHSGTLLWNSSSSFLDGTPISSEGRSRHRKTTTRCSSNRRQQLAAAAAACCIPNQLLCTRAGTAVVVPQPLNFYYRAYGNEERDKRLEVVKLLTAFSYCVGGCFICSVFQYYSQH